MSSSYNVFYYTVFTVHPEEPISVAIIFEKEISNLVRGVDCFENGDRVCVEIKCDRFLVLL
jgi:hypothetical protein